MSPDLSFDDATFSGRVPLFPLPGCVLLPGGLLPLHVFEPRYRQMVSDALDAERLIAMALLRPGYEAEYHGAPAIEPYVCVGRIILQQELEGGRYNMILAGLRRARILEEDHSRPYRVAQVELLPDRDQDAIDATRAARALRARVESLPAALIRYGARLQSALELLSSEVPDTIGIGQAVDLVAEALELTIADRLALLRLPRVPERLAALESILTRREREAGGSSAPTAWPPTFSQN